MAVAAVRRFGTLQFKAQKFRTRSSKEMSTVFAVPKLSPKTELWNDAMLKGSELVGFNNNDSISEKIFNTKGTNFQPHLLKTMSCKHPIAHSLKDMVYGNRVNPKLFGLISLLVAKAAGHSPVSPNYEEALANEGITSRQRKLADGLELYRSSFLIHSNILVLQKEKDGEISKSLQQVNGVGVLGGDNLAANASVILASIRENKVFSLIARGTIDFSESFFHWEIDKNGNALPDPVKPLAVWEHATFLEHASLLAQGCEAMMVLAGHSEDVGKVAGTIGKSLAMAIKVHNDMNAFEDISKYITGTPFSVVLLPIIMHLESDRQLLDEISSKGKDDIMNLDFQRIYSAVQNGNGMQEASIFLSNYIQTAEENLTTLGSSKSADVLQSILRSL